ncbi:hypothetical protein L3V83_13095 [Thiotrichales bacterium 19X7-9]|nr:hypothetical protein [Thiotrichales bacterium 19X7-9]
MFKPNYTELKNKVEDLIECDRKEYEKDQLIEKPKEIQFFNGIKRKPKRDKIFSIIPFLRRDAS